MIRPETLVQRRHQCGVPARAVRIFGFLRDAARPTREPDAGDRHISYGDADRFHDTYSAFMATPTEVVQQFVAAFVSAWPTADASRVAALFAEDASYHNGPLEPVHGRDAIETTLAGFMAMGGEVAVDMVHMLAGDQVVMTERVDHFVIDGKTFSLPVMGIFEIDNGQIRAWRDYFDLAQFSSLFTDEP